MDALIFLVPIAVGLGALFAALFLYAASRGQFDDLEDPAVRMFDED
jgi:cbb3-type cytochrome oxidase maturation protein